MYSLVALAHADEAARPAVAEALAGAGAAVAPTMEGSFNGGDLIAHFAFADEPAYRARRAEIDAALARGERADTVFFRHGEKGVAAPGLSKGVYRALLLCADHDATRERLDRFEAEMTLMPKYIPAIRNWRFSPVIEATGELGWTHVWEQEYEGVEGLLGPYMLHPYHWARIDRWFDPECPEWLVNTRLCHSFGALGANVIG
jgi:hypothetical protein